MQVRVRWGHVLIQQKLFIKSTNLTISPNSYIEDIPIMITGTVADVLLEVFN